MKILILGAVHRTGVAKKTGSAYDFAVLHVAGADSFRSSEKMQVSGAGLVPREIRTTLDVVKKLQAVPAVKFPFVAELQVENDFGQFGQMEAVCKDVALPPALAAVGTRVAG